MQRNAAEEAVATAWAGAIEIVFRHLQTELYIAEKNLSSHPAMEGHLEPLKRLMKDEVASEQLLLTFFGDEEAPTSAVMEAA